MSVKIKKQNSPFKARLLTFIRYLGMGQTAFEASVPLPRGSVNNIKIGMKQEAIDKILSKYPILNEVWLKTGHGEMLMVSATDDNKSTVEDRLDQHETLESLSKALLRLTESNYRLAESNDKLAESNSKLASSNGKLVDGHAGILDILISNFGKTGAANTIRHKLNKDEIERAKIQHLSPGDKTGPPDDSDSQSKPGGNFSNEGK